MSGFSTDWLALREHADLRARNASLARLLGDHLARQSPVRVVDVGAGTGANLRATAPHLGPLQSWHLLDHDPELLAAAGSALAAWADEAEIEGSGLFLTRGAQHIHVTVELVDLSAHPEAAVSRAPHLVTASAFFDLASAPWIERFTAAVARAQAVFFTVLTCDGRNDWAPPHATDAAIAAAFRTHQGRDKGFGPAAGDVATDLLLHAFHQHGYETRVEDSPWLLDAGDAADRRLMAALATGTADAAGETGFVPPARLDAWLEDRRQAQQCRIGHADLLAWPKTSLQRR